MSYLKDREIWLSDVPNGNPPVGYVWAFIQNGVFVVRDSNGVDKVMASTEGTITNASSSSYVEYSDIANKPTLISGSAQVNYTELSNIPSNIVSSSIQVLEYGAFATTGSNQFNGSQTITGSLTVTGEVVAQTLNVQQVTSSIVYSSGSNIFGNNISNVQQFTGSLQVSGSNHYLSGNLSIGTAATHGNVTFEQTTGEAGLTINSSIAESPKIYLRDAGGANYSEILANNKLYINASNVGIGTASPGAKLEIYGTGNTLRLDSAANQSKTILLRNVGSGTGELKTDGDLRLNAEDAGKTIQFYTVDTERMRLNASGNLSIGNTNDTYKLDVTGEGRFYQSATTSTAYLRVENNRSRNAALRLTTTIGDYYLGVGIGADVNQFQIYDGNAGSNRLTIASTGAATFSSSVTATQLNATTTAAGYGAIITNTNGASDSNGLLVRAGSISTEYVVRFAPQSDASTFFTVKGNGNVGIGTPSPLGKLDVYRAAGGSGTSAIVISNGEGGGGRNWGLSTEVVTAGDFAILQSTTNGGTPSPTSTNVKFYINPSGNVGIGTSIPQFSLALPQDSKVGWNDAGSAKRGSITVNSSADAMVFATGTSDTERMRITSGGNVEVRSAGELRTYRSDNARYGTFYTDNNYVHIAASVDPIKISTPERLEFHTSGNERMRIAANGEVTFGVTAAYDTSLLWRTDFTGAIQGRIYATGAPRVVVVAGESNGVQLTSGATSWSSNSDERLKNINGGIENAVEKLLTLRTVKFSWKSDESNKENLGLIAQDVEKEFPQVIDKGELATPEKEQIDKTEYLSIRYTELIPVLIKSIQELKSENDNLKSRIEALEQT